MHVYCLFCRTQRCKRIAQLMEIRGADRAFSPQIIQRHRKQGQNLREARDLVPGYVFIFNGEELTDYRFFFGMDGVIRRVGRPEEWYELQGADREFALNLLERDGVVGAVQMVKIGDKVKLDDPLFAASRGEVTKVDYRKERARIDFVFDGHSSYVWVSMEQVKEIDRNAVTGGV